jgi:hypothetical protein
MPCILLRIVIELLLLHESRHAQLRQVRQEDALLGVEGDLAVGAAPAVHAVEELLDLGARLQALFELAGREVLLVAEVGQALVDDEVERLVDGRGREIRRADGEDVRDELGVVLAGAVDDGAAPGRLGCERAGVRNLEMK